MKTGTCLRPSWTAIVCPTISGKIVDVRDQVRIICLLPDSFMRVMRPISRSSTNGPFLLDLLNLFPHFYERSDVQNSTGKNAQHFFRRSSLALTPPSCSDDQLVGFLVLAARALAERRDAPGRHRVAPALRLALAAAVGVVDRVHRRATYGRPLAPPAAPARLAARDVLVVDVADLPNGGAARERHPARLTRRQSQDAVALVLRDELHARAGRPRHLAALAGLQLDIVDECAGRDVRQRQRVPGLDVCSRARFDYGADPQPSRSENVRLRAVRVVEQCDPGR